MVKIYDITGKVINRFTYQIRNDFWKKEIENQLVRLLNAKLTGVYIVNVQTKLNNYSFKYIKK